MSGSLSDLLRQVHVVDDSDAMQSSQDCVDFLGSADFITPVEQQFTVDFSHDKENQTLPPGLPSKRPRERGAEDLPPNADARLVAVRQRVMSPPCIRNPFLDYEDFQKCNSKVPGSQSRYHEEFHEIEEIGRGNFSRVHKVLKRIDGCLYAMKRSQGPLAVESERKRALREVQALAYLGSHENVVRYFSSWMEDDFLYIQLELCESTLRQKTTRSGTSEQMLLEAMYQSLKGLAHIHSRGVVHLDLKPDNIYCSAGVYKIGDFGSATLMDASLGIDEGDARYLPLELLNDVDLSELEKADIFSLGATFYELARGTPLTSSGSQFHALRQGKLCLLPGFSVAFQALLKGLMHPDPTSRPTAAEARRNAMFKQLSC